jgi:hypothetical protein
MSTRDDFEVTRPNHSLTNSELADAIHYCCQCLDAAPRPEDTEPEQWRGFIEPRPIYRHTKAVLMLEEHLGILLGLQAHRSGYQPMLVAEPIDQDAGGLPK